MPDTEETLWEVKPHTLAKHEMLKGYLKAWMAILSRQSVGRSQKIKYVDGFAGPGEYKGGEPGSPVIAIDVATQHSHELPTPIEMIFIEGRKDRADHLRSLIEKKEAYFGRRVQSVDVKNGDCERLLSEHLRQTLSRGEAFGPALVFLDQFGYSQVSMSTVAEVMAQPQSEVFIFFNWRDLNRYLSDETKHSGITHAFGSDDWKGVMELAGRRREQTLLQKYLGALKSRGGADFVTHFSMYDQGGQLICWLLFGSNNLRGLEEMKSAMWRVDSTGHFQFSDKHADQLKLLEGYDEEWLAVALREEFLGQALTLYNIKRYVLEETPCVRYKGALKILEDRDELVVVNSAPERRRGAFGEEGMVVEFKNASQGFLFDP